MTNIGHLVDFNRFFPSTEIVFCEITEGRFLHSTSNKLGHYLKNIENGQIFKIKKRQSQYFSSKKITALSIFTYRIPKYENKDRKVNWFGQ